MVTLTSEVPPGFLAIVDQDKQTVRAFIADYIKMCEVLPMRDSSIIYAAMCQQLASALTEPNGLPIIIGIAAMLLTDKLEESRKNA